MTDMSSTAEHANQDPTGETGLIDMAIVFAQNLRLLILGPLLAGLVALGLSFLAKPVYTAAALILPPQQQQNASAAALQSLGALASLAGAAGVKNPVDQYVSLMQSGTVSDRIIQAFALNEAYGTTTRVDTRKVLAANVNISVGKKDGLLNIAVDDTDPKRAAAIANRYVDELRRLMTELAVTEAQQRRAFFERQLKQTRDRLTAAQQTLQGSGINEGALRAEPKAAAEAYADLKAHVTAAEVRLQSMRNYLTESAPAFKHAQSELVALKAQLNKTEIVDAQAASGDYINKYREFKYQETLFELFARQFEMAKVDESREGTVIQVVDPATPPERKSKPLRAKNAVTATLIVGFALLLFVLVREAWRKASQDESTAQKLARLKAALRGRR